MGPAERKRLDAFIALRQRYHWSVALFEALKPYVERELRGEVFRAEEDAHAVGLSAYWFGSLYVLVEGWRELGFTHPGVDPYLADPRIEVLRKFRNFVFHFQPDPASPKGEALLAERGAMMGWVLELATAINSVLSEHYADIQINRIAGWLLHGNTNLAENAV